MGIRIWLPHRYLRVLFSVGLLATASLHLANAWPTNLDREYVHSLPEYVLYMRSHIQRVVLIGSDIRENERFSNQFEDVDPEVLKEYLSRYHDRRKIKDWQRKNSMARKLEANYGIDKNKLPPEERARYQAIIDELNDGDKEERREFLSKLPPEIVEKLLRIERIADQIDRVMSEVSEEEWNKIMEPASTSEWLKDEKDREIAEFYERPFRDPVTKKQLYGPDGRPLLDRSYYKKITMVARYQVFLQMQREAQAARLVKRIRCVQRNIAPESVPPSQ